MLSRRAFLLGTVSAAALLNDVEARLPHGTAQAASQWSVAPIGGGGFSINLAMHSSGAMLTGVDVYGAYLGNTVAGTPWTPLISSTSVPASYQTSPYLGGGCYAIAFDPSNVQNLWMYFSPAAVVAGGCSTVFKSTNGGKNWSTTGFHLTSLNSNVGDSSRFGGQRIAVDPANSNIVYVADGATNLYVTTDGGVTFNPVSTANIPLPTTDAGYAGIVFDAASGTTGGATNRILVGSNGNGIYQTTNAGGSWALITGSPTSIGKAYLASDRNYYVCTENGGSLTRITTGGAVTSFSGGANGIRALAINPFDPGLCVGLSPEVFLQTVTGALNASPAFTLNFTEQPITAVTANDCPWLAGYQGFSLSDAAWDPLLTTSTSSITIGTGSITFTCGTNQNIAVGDTLRVTNTPTVTNFLLGKVTAYNPSTGVTTISVGTVSSTGTYLSGHTGGTGTFTAWTVTKERVWFTTGTGVFYYDQLLSTGDSAIISQTAGIESLVASTIIWPPNGTPIATCEDIAFCNFLNNPLSTTGLGSVFTNSNIVIEGNHVDWALGTPATIIGINEEVLTGSHASFQGINTTSGVSGEWSAFSTAPTAKGWPIAFDTTHYAVCPLGTGTVQFTADGGVTWTNATGGPSSVPQSGASPFTQASPATKDQVTAGTGYIYANSNVYKTTNFGAAWSVVGTITSNNFQVQLKAAPSNAGHLFFTAGPFNGTFTGGPSGVISAHPNTQQFWFSKDGGATWNALPNVAEVLCFGFCAPAAGATYPSIGFIGWVSGVYSGWRIDNFNPSNLSATTYTNIGIPANYCTPICMEGDPSQFGRFIVGTAGGGYVIYASAAQGWP